MVELSRRRLFGFGVAFLAAPAIVRVAALMPISVLPPSMHPYTAMLIEAMQDTWYNVAVKVMNEAFETEHLRVVATERYLTNYKDWREIYGAIDQVRRS